MQVRYLCKPLLDQAELSRLLDGRGPALYPELAIGAPQMPAYGAGAHVQVFGHFGVRDPPGDEREDF